MPSIALKIRRVNRWMLLCFLSGTLTAHAQSGLTITASHPRIWWTPQRIQTAKAWFSTHPFTPPAANIGNADQWAFHYLVSGTSTDCTTNAIPAVLKYQMSLTELEGVASDSVRYYGEVAALVYDWCNAHFTPSDAQLLRDRWVGTTSSVNDSPHTPTDLASVPGTKVLTSASAPFLPNMAGNNVIRINGGTNFVAGIYGIVTFNTGNSVTLDKDPTNALSASAGSGRVSGYVDSTRLNSWGGKLTSPGSNYFWGYWRNEVLWGVAVYGENTYATTLLNDAIGLNSSRWTTFLDYANASGPWSPHVTSAKGGILTEGSEYGRYQWWYQHLTNSTVKLLGRNLFADSNWFKEAVLYLIYSTTVAPTSDQNGHTYFQVFPFNDDEGTNSPSVGYPLANTHYYGDMLSVVAQEYSGTNIGGFARQWLNIVNPGFTNYVAAVDPGGSPLPLSALPLDYFAPGMGMLFSKNTWSSAATQVRIIGGVSSNGGHTHWNAGDFAILRNGNWLSKEFTAYGDAIVCSYGQICSSALDQGHNGILIGPSSPTTCNIGQGKNYPDGYGQVIRLESQPDYSYMAIDLSAAYRATSSSQSCRDDNPYAATVQREFLFIKPLETLVVFDRLLSQDGGSGTGSHPTLAAAQAVKTVMIHSPVAPTIGSNSVTWNNNGQSLKLYTLLPSSPTYTNINEGNFSGHRSAPNFYQQRLEISTTGTAQSHVLNVLQSRDTATGQDFTTAAVTDNSNSYTVSLQHPTLGAATIVFQKGSTSSGGSFGYAATGTPVALISLSPNVRGPTVTESGVTWPSAVETASPSCDLNNDGIINILDAQIAVNQALGLAPCGGSDLVGQGGCSVVRVQRVINAAVGQPCRVGQ